MTAFPARNAPKSLTKLPHCPFSGNDSLGWFYRRLSFLLPERASPSSIVPRVRFVTEISDSTPNAPCVALKLKSRPCATLLRIKSAILPNEHNLEYVSSYTPDKTVPSPFLWQHQIWDTKVRERANMPILLSLSNNAHACVVIYFLRKHIYPFLSFIFIFIKCISNNTIE